MKIISIIVLALISHSLAWALDNPFIDQNYKATNEKMERTILDCKKGKKRPQDKIKCRKDIFKQYQESGKIRGTEEYCESNYKKLNFSQLENLRIKMLKQQESARHAYKVMYDEDRQLGEITKEDLQTEIMWIESRLAQMQKANVQKMKKSIKYKKSWGKEQDK